MLSHPGSVPPASPGGASKAGAPASRAGRVSNARGCLTVLAGVAVLAGIALVATWAAAVLIGATGR